MDDNDDEFDIEMELDTDMDLILAAMDKVEETQAKSLNLNNNKRGETSAILQDNNDISDEDMDDDFGAIDVDALVQAAETVEKQKATGNKKGTNSQSSLATYFTRPFSTSNIQGTTTMAGPSRSNNRTTNNDTNESSEGSNSRITFGLPDDMRDPIPPPPPPTSVRTYHPFDRTNITTWIYPTNNQMRGYQFNIVRKALFSNTLVSIPTGLGKTFIAAVIMYNYYRWFPNSIIIFLAPTRPLVEQQVKACHDVCGIPQKDVVMMVGSVGKNKRPEQWAKGRVFFCTPQVVDNDLSNGICPAHKVSLVVIDEAHRATGNYAYTNVIEKLGRIHSHFRVLALSATPGSAIDKVQAVVTNLRINNIEVRTEESMDVQEFSFGKRVQTVVIKLAYTAGATGIVPRTADFFCQQFFRPVLDRLHKYKAIYDPSPDACSHFMLMSERKRYQINAKNVTPAVKAMVYLDFILAENLSRAYEGLCVYGVATFVDIMDRLFQDIRSKIDNGKNIPKEHYKLLNHFGLNQQLDRLRQEMERSEFIGHPKLEKLLDIILHHLNQSQQQHENNNESNTSSTRIIVFSSLRISVKMIVDFLSIHEPMIRCTQFVGQADDANGMKGMNQRDQQQAIERFKKGEINVMVATSIGEEGLDIGEVDLIICYDSQSSSIRLLQRMGRTGRRRKGHCVMLMTEQEERKFNKANEKYKYIQNAITKHGVIQCFPSNPSIIPDNYQPVLQRKHLTITNYLSNLVTGKKRRRQGDKFSSFKKDGTLTEEGLETFLASFPNGGCSSIHQAHGQFWPAVSVLKHASKYLSLQKHRTPIKRVGHSHRTAQFIELIRKMEHQILYGNDEDKQEEEMLNSSDHTGFPAIVISTPDQSNVLKMPRRRNMTSDTESDQANQRQQSNMFNIPQRRKPTDSDNSDTSNLLNQQNHHLQDSTDLTLDDDNMQLLTKGIHSEDSVNDGDNPDHFLEEVDEYSSMMGPLITKGVMGGDDDDGYDIGGFSYDFDSNTTTNVPYSSSHNNDSNNVILSDVAPFHSAKSDQQKTDKNTNASTIPMESPTRIADKGDDDDDDDDDEFGSFDMDLWDEVNEDMLIAKNKVDGGSDYKHCMATLQFNLPTPEVPNDLVTASTFLFDDDLPPLVSVIEHDDPTTMATTFLRDFTWSSTQPIFSEKARQLLWKRIGNTSNRWLSVIKDDGNDFSMIGTSPFSETMSSHILNLDQPELDDDFVMDDFGNKTIDLMSQDERQALKSPQHDDDQNNEIPQHQENLTAQSNIVNTLMDPVPNNHVHIPHQDEAISNKVLTTVSNIPAEKEQQEEDEAFEMHDDNVYSWEINDDMLDRSTLQHEHNKKKDQLSPSTSSPILISDTTPQQAHQEENDKIKDSPSHLLNDTPQRSLLTNTPNECRIPKSSDRESECSPILQRKRSRRKLVIQDTDDEDGFNRRHQNNEDDNDDNDDDNLDLSMNSISPADNERNEEQHTVSDHVIRRKARQPTSRSKDWTANPFLDVEAARSDDGEDTDDEDDSRVENQSMMNSFIYDGSSELGPDGSMVLQQNGGQTDQFYCKKTDMSMYRTSLLQQDVAMAHGAPPIFEKDYRRKTWLDKMETDKWEQVAADDDDDDNTSEKDDNEFFDAQDTILDDGVDDSEESEDISNFTNASDDFM
ncbi:uncharacterized protein BX664DRAFT_275297 [Halteromyces radiatus]|uniref:uncharacterized protein n=1 Tax=Halteromyces radiatus TaxID=101107 RepID=UPI00221E7B92|nr:uncharacterized protein BX664DRAFT_275297 [Halteromyces radiatus]KAI8096906.1 hypothetical protein BX664DRAFT_275297 [Halteromyces radiatus]